MCLPVRLALLINAPGGAPPLSTAARARVCGHNSAVASFLLGTGDNLRLPVVADTTRPTEGIVLRARERVGFSFHPFFFLNWNTQSKLVLGKNLPNGNVHSRLVQRQPLTERLQKRRGEGGNKTKNEGVKANSSSMMIIKDEKRNTNAQTLTHLAIVFVGQDQKSISSILAPCFFFLPKTGAHTHCQRLTSSRHHTLLCRGMGGSDMLCA